MKPSPLHHGLAAALLAALVPGFALAGVTPVRPWPPLAAYVMDEGSGLVTADDNGLLDGELEGGLDATGWSAGGPFTSGGGHHLVLDGADDRVLLLDGRVLANLPGASVSAWFRWSNPLDKTKEFTLYSERDACDFNIFWLGIDTRVGAPNGLGFGIFDTSSSVCGAGSWNRLTHAAYPSEDEWHHVVAVFDATSGMRLYLDGLLVASNTITAGFHGPTAGLTTIGHTHTASYDGFWQGGLDEVALFGYALSDEQAAWLHAHSLSELGVSAPSFCDASDGALAACPCSNPGAPATGCDIAQGTGGVYLSVAAQETSPQNRATLSGTGFPVATAPSVLVIRGPALDTASPVVFGDGLRCVGAPLVRLAATVAAGGASEHDLGHAAMAGGGTFYYQLWFRNTPAMFCTPDAFNLSNGRALAW